MKAQENGDRKPIKTWSRKSTITPDFVGLNFTVHNGKRFPASVCHRKHGGAQTWGVFSYPFF